MSDQNAQPVLGQRLGEHDHSRDAVHLAIVSVVAAHELIPGQHIGLIDRASRLVGESSEPIGIVDPFLTGTVHPGERFYLCLYPNTVTGMRHVWSHPAFNVR